MHRAQTGTVRQPLRVRRGKKEKGVPYMAPPRGGGGAARKQMKRRAKIEQQIADKAARMGKAAQDAPARVLSDELAAQMISAHSAQQGVTAESLVIDPSVSKPKKRERDQVKPAPMSKSQRKKIAGLQRRKDQEARREEMLLKLAENAMPSG
eukprot:COSAG05_NODE_241_length_13068_cov_438.050968_5_plen_152_part_00